MASCDTYHLLPIILPLLSVNNVNPKITINTNTHYTVKVVILKFDKSINGDTNPINTLISNWSNGEFTKNVILLLYFFILNIFII